MPFGDGTGPMGLGPMTGRGAGYCAGFGTAGFANPMPGYRYPYGYGHLGPHGPGGAMASAAALVGALDVVGGDGVLMDTPGSRFFEFC